MVKMLPCFSCSYLRPIDRVTIYERWRTFLGNCEMTFSADFCDSPRMRTMFCSYWKKQTAINSGRNGSE
jgi:hypothetical protein